MTLKNNSTPIHALFIVPYTNILHILCSLIFKQQDPYLSTPLTLLLSHMKKVVSYQHLLLILIRMEYLQKDKVCIGKMALSDIAFYSEQEVS